MTFTVTGPHLGFCNTFLPVTFSSHYIKSTLSISWFPQPLFSRILYVYAEQHKAHTPVELCWQSHYIVKKSSLLISSLILVFWYVYTKQIISSYPKRYNRVPLMNNCFIPILVTRYLVQRLQQSLSVLAYVCSQVFLKKAGHSITSWITHPYDLKNKERKHSEHRSLKLQG